MAILIVVRLRVGECHEHYDTLLDAKITTNDSDRGAPLASTYCLVTHLIRRIRT